MHQRAYLESASLRRIRHDVLICLALPERCVRKKFSHFRWGCGRRERRQKPGFPRSELTRYLIPMPLSPACEVIWDPTKSLSNLASLGYFTSLPDKDGVKSVHDNGADFAAITYIRGYSRNS